MPDRRQFLQAAAGTAGTLLVAPVARAAGPSLCVETNGPNGWVEFGLFADHDCTAAVRAHLQAHGTQVRVRPSPRSIPVPVPPAPLPRPDGEVIGAQAAHQAFSTLAARREIAFHFPTDGCYARAHLMCVLLRSRGLHPHKVWTFANGERLTVRTTHDPRGQVSWGYHVAPTLRVWRPTAAGVRAVEEVFDPSLFGRPVPAAEWVAAQTHSPAHRPFVRHSRFGEAPDQPHHGGRHGTGYWVGDDPATDLTRYSLRLMDLYKPLEDRVPPSPLPRP